MIRNSFVFNSSSQINSSSHNEVLLKPCCCLVIDATPVNSCTGLITLADFHSESNTKGPRCEIVSFSFGAHVWNKKLPDLTTWIIILVMNQQLTDSLKRSVDLFSNKSPMFVVESVRLRHPAR